MDFKKLQVFYEVARLGSMSRAAGVLGVDQSCISRWIGILENVYRAKLLERRDRGVFLTPQGKKLFSAAEKIFSIQSSVMRELRIEGDDPEREVLRILSPSGWTSTLILPGIEEFLDQNSLVDLDFFIADSFSYLLFDECDAAVLSFHDDRDDLVQEYLMTFHIRLYASPDYLKKNGVPKIPEDLDQHRIFSYASQDLIFTDSMSYAMSLGRNGKKNRSARLSVNSAHQLYELGRAGLGIIPMARENRVLEEGLLEEVLPEAVGSKIASYYIYPKIFQDKPSIHAFGDYLKNQVKLNGWS